LQASWEVFSLKKQAGQGIKSATQIPLFLQVYSITTVLFFALLWVFQKEK
jgi:hypothetical protein